MHRRAKEREGEALKEKEKNGHPFSHRSDKSTLSVDEEVRLLLVRENAARARPHGGSKRQHELIKEGPARQRHIGGGERTRRRRDTGRMLGAQLHPALRQGREGMGRQTASRMGGKKGQVIKEGGRQPFPPPPPARTAARSVLPVGASKTPAGDAGGRACSASGSFLRAAALSSSETGRSTDASSHHVPLEAASAARRSFCAMKASRDMPPGKGRQ